MSLPHYSLGATDVEHRRLIQLASHGRSGTQTITVTVPRAPTRVAIDPHHKLIERELDFSDGTGTNNVEEVAGVGRPRLTPRSECARLAPRSESAAA